MESPGYSMLFELLRLRGVHMIEVPRTPNGPDINVLEALLLQYRPRALFINSFYHNPTGSSLTPKVAQQILQLAKTHCTLVVEDDVYADLSGGPGTRLAALDTAENVIYVGSFSKTLSSSLRVGFVVAGAGVVSRLAEVKMVSSMGASQFCESVVACLLASGAYRKLVQRQRQRLNSDRETALQVLEDAEWEVFGKPAGACSSGRDRPWPTTLKCGPRHSASASSCLQRRPSVPPASPVTGSVSTWPMPVIREPGRFSKPPLWIDLKRSENDVGVAFCHYSSARDLC